MSYKTDRLREYIDRFEPEELFNFIAENLIRQKRQSYDGVACRYHGPDGLRCAVGFVIPDEFYDEQFEGLTVENLIAGNRHVMMLKNLQQIHDYNPPSMWRASLVRLAESYGFDYPYGRRVCRTS